MEKGFFQKALFAFTGTTLFQPESNWQETYFLEGIMSHKLVTVLCSLVMGGTLAACDTNPTREQISTGAGAAIGGVAGHVLTDGSTLGTIGGAAAGGVVGNEVSKPDAQ